MPRLAAALALAVLAAAAAARAQVVVDTVGNSAAWLARNPAAFDAWPADGAYGSTNAGCGRGDLLNTDSASTLRIAHNGVTEVQFVELPNETPSAIDCFDSSGGTAFYTTGIFVSRFTVVKSGIDDWKLSFNPPVKSAMIRLFLNNGVASGANTYVTLSLQSGDVVYSASAAGFTGNAEETVGFTAPDNDLITGMLITPDNVDSRNNGFQGLWVAPYDVTPPTFDAAPAAGTPAETSIPVTATLNEWGRLHCAAYANAAPAPSSAQVRDGEGTGFVAAAPAPATPQPGQSVTVPGLAPFVDYDVYCAADDDEVPGNLQALPVLLEVKTADATPPTASIQTAAADVTGAADGPRTIVVRYDDNVGLVEVSFNSQDLTVDGGLVSTYISHVSAGGNAFDVTYEVAPAASAPWSTDGTFTVGLAFSQVADNAGFHVEADATFDSFTVNVPPAFDVAPSLSGTGAHSLLVAASLDEAGTVHCAAYETAASPGAPAVIGASAGAASVVAAASQETAGGDNSVAGLELLGLDEAAEYFVYCAGVDAVGNQGAASGVVSRKTADVTPPEVDETTALPAVTQANAGPVDLVLTFTDSVAMNRDTYTAENALVVDDARAKVAYKTHSNDVVTYSVSAQDGKWNQGDSATYTVSLAANKIFDAAGNPVPATAFTAFTVTIDETAPAFVASEEPVVHATTADSVTVRAQANEAGTLRCCAWPASAATRDADAIRGGLDGAQGCSAQAVAAANDDTFVELEGLTVSAGATFFDVWCLLEDDAPAAVLANEAAPFEIPNVLLGACPAGVAPQFDVAGSTITAGDDLLLKWRVSGGYESYKFAFVGAEGDDACSMQLPQAAASPLDEDPEWAFAVDGDSCDDDWTFTRNLADTLGACGFAKLEDDPLFTEFRATVEVTTVEDTGAEVFGQAVTQTRTTATEFGVRVPKAVSVTSGDVQAFPGFAGLEADGRSFAVVSTQAYDVSEEEFTLRVITAVAWPYVLQLDGTTPVERTSGSNTWTLGASFKGGDCDSGAAVDNVCVQQWDLTLDHIADCEVDGEYDLNFDVRCSDAFGNGDGCETHENPTASITIPVESDSVCARVVEVATVTPTLVTSTTKGGAQATDFVLQTTLYGRVSVAAEGGIATSSVVLTDLLIDSDCTSCVGGSDERRPLSDSSPDPVDDYSWDTTSGTTFADFEFQLNADSVPFDTGAGQASITMTATVAVTYVTADLQKVTETRRVQMQAGSGETVSARATANFGVGTQSGAAPSSGASSSAAVSGTVAVAAFVAIVAVVAGAAVVVRKRRAASASASAKKIQHSSSTADVAAAAVQLDILPAAEGAAAVVDASTLGSVQQAYGTIE